MRFQVSSTALYARLQALSRVINTKSTLTILESILFEVEESQLKMTASDSETTLVATLDLDEVSGSVNGQLVKQQ